MSLAIRSTLDRVDLGFLAPHVARVVHDIREKESTSTSDADVVASMRRRRLLPAKLDGAIATLAPRLSEAEREGLAIGFAASIYPQQASSLETVELAGRLERFAEVMQRLRERDRPENEPLDAGSVCDCIAASSVPGECPASGRLQALAREMCAAGYAKEEQEIEARALGGALTLATYVALDWSQTTACWPSESEHVRAFREFATMPPSTWSRGMREQIQALAAAVQLAQLDALEAKVRSKIALARHGAAQREATTRLWEGLWAHLVSGFPYYRFRAPFHAWFLLCVSNERFERDPAPLLPELAAAADPAAGSSDLRFGHLRLVREGYRLVRSTFSSLSAERGTRELRQRLDHLFHARIVTVLSDERDDQSLGSGDQELLRRLRLRLWAYWLARVERRSNGEIRASRAPRALARENAAERPLKDEPGIETLATLARVAPCDSTLLAPLLFHALLHPAFDRRTIEPWERRDFEDELAAWLSDPSFVEVVQAGATRADRCFAEVLAGDPSSRSSGQTRSGLRDAVRAARRLVERRDLRLWQPHALRGWRNRAPGCWLVPLWYLMCVEREESRVLRNRLRIDEAEREVLDGLLHRLQKQRSHAHTAEARS